MIIVLLYVLLYTVGLVIGVYELFTKNDTYTYNPEDFPAFIVFIISLLLLFIL